MKIEYLEGLGEVSFIKRKNSSRITVKIEPYEKITVSLPYYISYKMAKSYLFKNLSVIKQKAETLNQKVKPFNEETTFQTKWHKLKLVKGNILQPTYHINDHTVEVKYPQHKDISDLTTQETIREAIIETLRKEAKKYLPFRLAEIASQHGFSYNSVFIKNIKTQWGSCSYKNNINLNLHVMRLPYHLIDYVLAHELCHTVHKNHSTDFWNLLSAVIQQDVKILQKELRRYSPQIFKL